MDRGSRSHPWPGQGWWPGAGGGGGGGEEQWGFSSPSTSTGTGDERSVWPRLCEAEGWSLRSPSVNISDQGCCVLRPALLGCVSEGRDRPNPKSWGGGVVSRVDAGRLTSSPTAAQGLWVPGGALRRLPLPSRPTPLASAAAGAWSPCQWPVGVTLGCQLWSESTVPASCN